MNLRLFSHYSTIAAGLSCAAFFMSCAKGASDSPRPSDRSTMPSSTARSDANRSITGSNNNNGNNSPSGDISQLATDPDYKISNGDDIYISVFGEGNLSGGQR